MARPGRDGSFSLAVREFYFMLVQHLRQLLDVTMQQSDELVLSLEYVDSRGEKTRRIVSPIRYLSKDRFLGLCLCRCEPRQFHLDRCSNVQIKQAAEYLMPVALEQAI
jgi:predicted DNA-binding transcriptional regulator YafY